jgi:hypothetical protein
MACKALAGRQEDAERYPDMLGPTMWVLTSDLWQPFLWLSPCMRNVVRIYPYNW